MCSYTRNISQKKQSVKLLRGFCLNNRKPDVVRVLLDADSDVNARDEVGRTALMLTARWNTSRIIDTLLDAGADIAIKDDEGRQAAD